MMKIVFAFLVAIFFQSFIGNSTLQAQSNAAALAAADTVHFSRNAKDGWELYNSYMAPQGNDSIRLELILQHANNINWSDEQYIGKIKTGNYFPLSTRTVSFSLMQTNFLVRIDENGKCYLKVLSGPLPAESTAVVPFIIAYRK
jgi:hypothetical protein